jgi:hypothetical protein
MAKAAQTTLQATGREVVITNRYKVFFPQAGHTKLNLATSYNGTLYLALNADVGAAPDAGRLRHYLVESYLELRGLAGVRGS